MPNCGTLAGMDAPARKPFAGAGRGSTRAWRKLRAQVLAAEPRCRLCGATSTEADHIIPVSRGGSDTRTNLRGVCRRCNLRRNAQLTRLAPRTRGSEPHPGDVTA